MPAQSQEATPLKHWAPIAYTRLLLYTTAYILKSTVRHIFGRTPKGQTLLQGYTIMVLRLMMAVKVLSVPQARKMMDVSNAVASIKPGLFSQKAKDQWATKVKGQGWEGFWIPFQDQLNKTTPKQQQATKVTAADIGAGCDIVMFAIHGGGMVLGDALMFLGNYKSWMKIIQKKHNIKIGVLTIEYSLSPETPYPGALNECVAAYRHLVEHQGVDPRRIVMCGDSAGANLCLTTALRLRDDHPTIGLPAGQVLFSPYVMCPKPMRDSPDDYITSHGHHLFVRSYTQNMPKIQTSPYASPIRTASFAGMPRMLVFIGGVESLRPSIESFVAQARGDGVEVQSVLKEGMAHDYCLIAEIASPAIIQESEETLARFVAQARDRYIGMAAEL